MKKYLLIFIVLAFFALPNLAFAQQNAKMYFFYGDGCPHCEKEELLLEKVEKEFPSLEIVRFEVWHNRKNADLMATIASRLGLTQLGVPLTIIGDQHLIGYLSDSSTGEQIRALVSEAVNKGCADIVAPIISGDSTYPLTPKNNGEASSKTACDHGCDQDNGECEHDCGCSADLQKGDTLPNKISLPLLGEVDTKNLSLPLFTMTVGVLDGFNPCAMWTLLFLISLLLGMENRKKMWILGAAFIFMSGLVYYLFMAAWLNMFLFIGFVFWVRIVIALVAVGSGVYHLREWYRNKKGVCKVTDNEKRKNIFLKIRKVVENEKFIFALVGIVLLAVAVNLVELLCSAGLPAIYTQILTLSDLPLWQYYSYLAGYIFFYMLDDLIIFVIAMMTLRMKGISSRYTRWSNLIGGILMLIVGTLLILKPGWLMFG